MPREDEKRTIAFVTYPGLTLLDLVGPITTFLGLTRGLLRTSREYETVSVGERVEPVDSDTPMALIPDKAVPSARRQRRPIRAPPRRLARCCSTPSSSSSPSCRLP